MFPDSKITKNSCGQTKTTNVLSGAVAKSHLATESLQTCASGLVLLLVVPVMKTTSFYPCLSDTLPDTLHQMVFTGHA